MTGVKQIPLNIEVVPIASLVPDPDNPREHSPAHVRDIAVSVEEFGMIDPPIARGSDRVILSGHGTVLACKLLGYADLPVIFVNHLSEVQSRGFRIAHNKLSETGGWNMKALDRNIKVLSAFKFDVTKTGFKTGEIDAMRTGKGPLADRDEDAPSEADALIAAAVSRIGDVYTIRGHKIVCGDSCIPDLVARAMAGEQADCVMSDMPFNLAVVGHVSTGQGKAARREFVKGSGELSRAEFKDWMGEAFSVQNQFAKPGAVMFQFIDWRSVADMILAGEDVFDCLLHMCIWNKGGGGGMGSLWRGGYEICLAFRTAGGKHKNNVMLSKYGRHRSDVWSYPGYASFGADRLEALSGHPTPKNVAMLADALLDVMPLDGLVLDPFLGSGSTILAADRIKRRAVGIELDPHFVDVAIRRLEKAFGEPAIHESGLTFAALADSRRAERPMQEG
jgi:DNA methylase/ParB-like nuclease domain